MNTLVVHLSQFENYRNADIRAARLAVVFARFPLRHQPQYAQSLTVKLRTDGLHHLAVGYRTVLVDNKRHENRTLPLCTLCRQGYFRFFVSHWTKADIPPGNSGRRSTT